MVVSVMLTLVVPILGLMQQALHTSVANISWVATATLLSAAVFTPLFGRLGDQYGKKPTMVVVMGVMVAGCVLAATTHSLSWLIVARVLQGAATAIFPLALSVLREEVQPERLPTAMALISGTLAFGSGVALVLTGLLTHGPGTDYHRVFWLATALAVLALAAVVVLVPSGPARTGGRVDVLGAATLAAALVLLLLPISQGQAWGWTGPRTVACFVGAAAMATVWVLVERRVREPLVDLRMFVRRPVLFTNLAGLFVGFGMFAHFIGVSYLAQTPATLTGYGFGASVLRTSVQYLLPSAIVALFAAQLGGSLVRRFGARSTLALSAVAGGGGFACLTLAHDTPFSVIGAGMAVGAGVSLGYAAMPALIVANVAPHQSGIANGINSISRTAGSAIGSAVVMSLLASNPIAHLSPGTPALPSERQFTISFAIAGVAFGLVAIICLLGLRTSPSRPASEIPADASDAGPAEVTGVPEATPDLHPAVRGRSA
ncbi:MFS transporter [Actinoplanes sp. NPDC051475]|uniref:MFS transporter n=1 Tax=Actinoplanes sp. NPDC051475 TaxID=3157225 RepID=UPI00344B3ED4